jgi:lipopolysaccharide export LptBFGC system permease protein LptF
MSDGERKYEMKFTLTGVALVCFIVWLVLEILIDFGANVAIFN